MGREAVILAFSIPRLDGIVCFTFRSP